MTIDQRIQALLESLRSHANSKHQTDASFQKANAALELLDSHVGIIAHFIRESRDGQSPQ